MPLLVQFLGSALVLLSFAANQAGRLSSSSCLYLVLNALGSLGLATSAVIGAQWGFVVLEGAWLAVSVHGLSRATRRASAGPHQ